MPELTQLLALAQSATGLFFEILVGSLMAYFAWLKIRQAKLRRRR